MTTIISGDKVTVTDFYYIGCSKCKGHVILVWDKKSGKFFGICEKCSIAMSLEEFMLPLGGKP